MDTGAINTYVRPLQAIPQNKKNDAWFKLNIDYLINQALIGVENNRIQDYYDIDRGEIPEALYENVLKPFYKPGDSDSREYSRVNKAELKHYPILTPLKNLHLGEYLKLPKNFPLTVESTDVVNRKKEKLKQKIKEAGEQYAINLLNDHEIETGMSSKPTQDPNQTKEEFETNYIDERVETMQIALDKVKKQTEFEEMLMKMYEDGLLTEQAYCYTGVHNGELIFEQVSPADVRVHFSVNSPYAEDGDSVVRLQHMTVSEILDRFHSELEKKDIQWLEAEQGYGYWQYSGSDNVFSTIEIDWRHNVTAKSKYLLNQVINVWHVCWKSYTEMKLLRFSNLAKGGEEDTCWVNADYKLNEELGDIAFDKSEYFTEVYQGYRIGDTAAGLYLETGRHPIQRTRLNNLSDCKLPYNGRADLLSLYKDGLQFQVMYNILTMQINKRIANDFGSLLSLPAGLMPDSFDDQYSWMEFAKDIGILVVDESSQNAQRAMEMLKIFNSALHDYVRGMLEIRSQVKNDLWEMFGVNPQRYGDIQTSAGKGTTDQAVYRSLVISLRGVNKFQNLLKRITQGLVDAIKALDLEKLLTSYVDNENKFKVFESNFDDIRETDFGVFAIDPVDEQDKIRAAIANIQPMIQNGVAPEAAMEVIDNMGADGSFTKLKQSIKRFSQITKEYEAKKSQAEQQAQQQLAQQAQQAAQQLQAFEKQMQDDVLAAKDKISQRQEETKRMAIESNVALKEAGEQGENPEQIAINKEKNMLQREKQQTDAMLKAAKLELDRKKIAQQKNQPKH